MSDIQEPVAPEDQNREKKGDTAAWEDDICPLCGSDVVWDIDHAGALEQDWRGICEGCGTIFKASLISTLESVAIVSEPERIEPFDVDIAAKIMGDPR